MDTNKKKENTQFEMSIKMEILMRYYRERIDKIEKKVENNSCVAFILIKMEHEMRIIHDILIG